MIRTHSALVAVLLAATSLVSPALSNDTVLVVDRGGTGDYIEIADALPHTGEGWTVLVRNGTYTKPVVIVNQGLTLVAEEGATVNLVNQIVVRDLGKTRDVILSGLHLDQGLLIENCQGLVRVQDCKTLDPELYDEPNGTLSYCNPTVRRHAVLASRGVTFVGCEFHGATGADAPNKTSALDALPGHSGLYVEDASVALYSTILQGGNGGSTSVTHSAGGGAGHGLYLASGAYARVGIPNEFSGGQGGTADISDGCDGDPIYVKGGSVDHAAHPELTLAVTAILRGDVPSPMYVKGPPGAVAYLLTAGEPNWRVLPASVGILHLLQPFTVTKLGTIPASGSFKIEVLLPPPPAKDKFESYQYQLFAAQSGVRFLSNPRRSVLLHPDL